MPSRSAQLCGLSAARSVNRRPLRANEFKQVDCCRPTVGRLITGGCLSKSLSFCICSEQRSVAQLRQTNEWTNGRRALIGSPLRCFVSLAAKELQTDETRSWRQVNLIDQFAMRRSRSREDADRVEKWRRFDLLLSVATC